MPASTFSTLPRNLDTNSYTRSERGVVRDVVIGEALPLSVPAWTRLANRHGPSVALYLVGVQEHETGSSISLRLHVYQPLEATQHNLGQRTPATIEAFGLSIKIISVDAKAGIVTLEVP